MAKQTLEQRMQHAAHIQIDDQPYPDTRLWCRRCGESLVIDYFQRGMQEMSRQLTSFVATHEKCPPQRKVNTDASLEAGIARAKARNYATRGKHEH